MNQAIRMSEIDNGDKMYWEVTDIDDFYYTYLEKYLQGVKYEKVTWHVTQANKRYLHFPDGSTAVFDLYLLDASKIGGHFIFCPYSKDCKYGTQEKTFGTKEFAFGFWPNTISNRVNIVNLMKYHQGKGVEPYLANWNGTETQLRNGEQGCKKDGSRPYYCTALIQRNGWKIPKDYPFKL